MYSILRRRFQRALALRLTLWYASIFTVSSALAFALVYLLILSFLHQRIDVDLREDIDEFAGLLHEGGLERVREKIAEDTQGDEAGDVYFRVWTPAGESLATSILSAWRRLDAPGTLSRLTSAPAPVLTTLTIPGRPYGVRTIIGPISPNVVLEIGQSMEEDEKFIEVLLRGFAITFGAIIVLVSPIGWFLARRALRGVEDITRTAAQIARGRLDQRVRVRDRGDELDRLAQTFNDMLDRIEALIAGMREMTDNLAHDLRSPLARIRAAAEMKLSAGDTVHESLAIDTIEECDRLLDIVNTTLDIAEAESGAAQLKLMDVDLAALTRDACEIFQTVAEDRQVVLTMQLPAHCRIQGDQQRLQRAVANLLDNALKYTPAGGRVTVVLIKHASTVRLSIEDTGVGIAADEIQRVFQRFYRCDRSRSRDGNGLGLNLARAFARAHGGEISAVSTLGKGSTFTVTLPWSAPHAGSPRPAPIDG